MNKPILVISTQYPGYGGASTNSYAIIKYLRQNGYNCIGVFIEDAINVNIDPDGIGNIYRFSLYPFKYNVRQKIIEYKRILDTVMKGPPGVILCKNYIAPVCSKIMYPCVKNIYLVSGLCNAIDVCTSIPANQMVKKKIKLPESKEEITAIKNSDIIVINSPLSYNIFYNTYSNYVDKIYPHIIDTTKYANILINNDNEKPISKKYDIIITSSILTRKEKNNFFLMEVLKNPIFDKYSKLIIGNDNSSFSDIPNSVVHDLLPHASLMELMRDTKVLLYPSLYDSNPNTIREAVHNKCLVLMSNNIGFYELFPDISVCDTYTIEEWTNKCIYLLDNYNEIIKIYQINFDNNNDITDIIDKLVQ
ncbi:glycosyltransferases group 1 [Tupanvirus soda lake]|uniref:Glycosyltransferases group 1 n=2 Tax=Tupanvirus TaxID=2094720 RepID=A0A6N1P2B9_9VIRU|nr:glycosyltransferases group 1 [Tupanvirus soda lake]QKU35171.1 glycosyltransferases group 1 [Tupanvirus soda lake]